MDDIFVKITMAIIAIFFLKLAMIIGNKIIDKIGRDKFKNNLNKMMLFIAIIAAFLFIYLLIKLPFK